MLYQQCSQQTLNRTVKKNPLIDASKVHKYYNKFGKQQICNKNSKKSKEYVLSPQEVKILLADIDRNNSTKNYNSQNNMKNESSKSLYYKHSYTHSSPNLFCNTDSESLKKELQHSLLKQELLMKKKLFDPHAYFGHSQTSQEITIDQNAKLQKKKLDCMLSKSEKDLRKDGIQAEIFCIKKLEYVSQNIKKIEKKQQNSKKQLRENFNNIKTPTTSPKKDPIISKKLIESKYQKDIYVNKIIQVQKQRQKEAYPSFESILSKVKSLKENLYLQDITNQCFPQNSQMIDFNSNPFSHLLQKQHNKFTNEPIQLQSINSNNLDSLKNSSCGSRSPSYNGSDNTVKQKRPHLSPKSVVRQSRQTFKIKLNQINQMKRMRVKLKLNGTNTKINV